LVLLLKAAYMNKMSLSGNSDDETVEQVESVDISVLQERHAQKLHDCVFKHSLKLRDKNILFLSLCMSILSTNCKSQSQVITKP